MLNEVDCRLEPHEIVKEKTPRARDDIDNGDDGDDEHRGHHTEDENQQHHRSQYVMLPLKRKFRNPKQSGRARDDVEDGGDEHRGHHMEDEHKQQHCSHHVKLPI